MAGPTRLIPYQDRRSLYGGVSSQRSHIPLATKRRCVEMKRKYARA